MDELKEQRLGGAVIHMKGVKYLIGEEGVCCKPLRPYSDEVCSFVAALSDAILKDSEARRYPDVMSFGFWCRKANLMIKKSKWEERTEKRLGRGLVFHIAPSNVPINFAFTYIFALLAGNANVVRVPSKGFPQVSIVCRIMKDVLDAYPEIKVRTAFVQYVADDEITEQFSMKADARVIWGGDETVNQIRSYKTSPRCIDVVFADRYSVCVLDGEALEEAEEVRVHKLAESFYNDTFLMDQNACSSPQMILWKNATEIAKERFWNAVFDYSKTKYYLQPASSVDKYLKFCMDAVEIDTLKSGAHLENLVYHVELAELPKNITELRGSCGYFYEYNIEKYEELLPVLTEKFQTVTYFGVNPEEIQEFVIENQVRGIDRIVPVGKSLDIDIIWDGYDIVGMLSRIVEVK